ncbi:MAG: tetratricopeptide repeat protein, partial [Gammaproteobacteria bacterium]|nr:tetratricopeptide repeat protein [Gammaproteobacteria bacterium]
GLGSRDLAALAVAAEALGDEDPARFRDAVRFYGEALEADPGDNAARVALGELLLAKYNNTEALEVFREALGREAGYAPAMLGLARSQHFDHDAEALATARASLAANPNLLPAHVFVARLLLESEQYQAAAAQAREALGVNPNSLEALAVLAAVHYLAGDEQRFAQTRDRCLAINPSYADLYNTLAETAVRNRLYHAAVDFARRAVAMDPTSWRGYGLLGLNQLRIGEMERGRDNLERAFAGDPYNVWFKNTLDLVDTFDEYRVIPGEHVVLVLHDDEAALLAPYVMSLAEQAYAHYASRYGYRPEERIRIELYPRHADFSVRTVGLAGIGLLGVSFGPVIALDSPAARPGGNFNWGSALWHELAHSFHLGMTGHRVPRWFSEGLAVYEEQQARPGWGADVTPDFLQALAEDRLQPVSRLNEGFVRPSYPGQIGHSYFQASLVFAFIDERWGFAAIRAMLEGYRDGLDTDELTQSVLGISPADFDHGFEEYMRERFAGALALVAARDEEPPVAGAPRDPYARELGEAAKAMALGDDDTAETHLKRAIELFPEYAGEDSAYWVLAELYARRDELAPAAAQLERMVDINADHYLAHVRLAQWREKLGEHAAAADALARAIYIHPYDLALHERLATLYARLRRFEAAAAERAAVLALEPVDMAEAHYQLALAYSRAGEREAARSQVLRALEIAPNFQRALELLLELRGQSSSDAAPHVRRRALLALDFQPNHQLNSQGTPQ